jgi:thiol:disulfide interchange protein DsbD
MKKLLTLIALIFGIYSGFSQAEKHVKWQTEFKDLGNNEGEINITAFIDKAWHTYSQKPSEGPIPTSFKFNPSSNYELIGKTEESASKEEFDKTFEATVFVFSDKAEFKQKIKLNSKKFNITVVVEYMICDASMCIMEGPITLNIAIP